MLSAKYGSRNRDEKNDLGLQELIDVDENRQQLVNPEIKKGV